MKDKIIQEYISKISLNDIENFAINNGINLKEDELKLIQNYIVNDWRTIYHGNPRGILDDLKNKLLYSEYIKIEQLYIYFKNRYL